MAKPKPNKFTDAQKSKRYRDKKKQKEAALKYLSHHTSTHIIHHTSSHHQHTSKHSMAKPKPNKFTDAQKSKRYRDKNKQKEENNTFSRAQKNAFLKAKQIIAQRRKSKNTKSSNTYKPFKVLGVVEKQLCNMSSSMNWMNKASTLQNHKYKRLETNMRHCCPTFCTGNTKVGGTDSDIWLLDDSGQWQFWFSRRISQFVGAGFGLIAGRDFKFDSIITRYMGETTTSQSVSDKWKKSSGYVFEFKKKGTNTSQKQWVCPDLNETYMYAHFINHSKTPNCQVDEYSGIFTSIRDIKKGEELTIDYGVDYNYTW